jgi:hypothetical protein
MDETVTSYTDGLRTTFKATANNTGAVTLNVDSVATKDLVTKDGSALTADDLVEDLIYSCRYNSTNDRFELQDVLTTTISASEAAAAASEAAAAASEAAAAASEAAAAASEGAAASSEAAAAASEAAAAASESTSGDNVNYSAEWANKAEDSLISVAAGGDGVNDYSALHWAAKAAGIVAGAIFNVITTGVNRTTANGEHVIVTTSGLTITLPASPVEGNRIRITVGAFKDTIIGRNGETILGVADDRIINQVNATVELVYANSDWEIL